MKHEPTAPHLTWSTKEAFSVHPSTTSSQHAQPEPLTASAVHGGDSLRRAERLPFLAPSHLMAFRALKARLTK